MLSKAELESKAMPPIQRPPNGGSGGGDDSKKSPLERYLEKQKSTKEPKPPSSIEARRQAQAPKAPTKSAAKADVPDMFKWAQPTPSKSMSTSESTVAPSNVSPSTVTATVQPKTEQPLTDRTRTETWTRTSDGNLDSFPAADVGSRFMAYAVDLAILVALDYPIRKILFGVLGLMTNSLGGETELAIGLMQFYVLLYFYFGVFYSKKGASPGKMLFGLLVIDESSGRFLTPGKAFFREAVGKFMSAVPFAIGFFAALFRGDRRALHDLLFDTRVLRTSGRTSSVMR